MQKEVAPGLSPPPPPKKNTVYISLVLQEINKHFGQMQSLVGIFLLLSEVQEWKAMTWVLALIVNDE